MGVMWRESGGEFMRHQDVRRPDIDRVRVEYRTSDGLVVRVAMMTFITARQRDGRSFSSTAGKSPTVFIEELIEFGESWVDDGMGRSIPVLLYEPHPVPATPVHPRARH